MALMDTKKFACDKILDANDRVEYVAILISLYYTEYCTAPKLLRDLFDERNEESRKLAIETAKKDKVDEYYDSLKDDKE